MMRLGIANIGRARLTVLASIAVTLALGVSSIGIEHRLSQPSFLVHGAPSERAFKVYSEHFGLGTAFAVLLEGRPAELRRQGPALAAALARTPNYSVVSPWTDRV